MPHFNILRHTNKAANSIDLIGNYILILTSSIDLNIHSKIKKPSLSLHYNDGLILINNLILRMILKILSEYLYKYIFMSFKMEYHHLIIQSHLLLQVLEQKLLLPV